MKPTIHDAPAYSAHEVASILGLPQSTIKAWCFGQGYRDHAGEAKRFQPVIVPADHRQRLLSFHNLCELHVLAGIRRTHRVALQRVRDSLAYLRDALHSSHPLIDRQFLTNGIDLFIKETSRLVNVSRHGQEALRGEFENALARIERDNSGFPVRLFPFSRTVGVAADQPRVVAVDPRIAFGRPMLLSAGVPTEVIVGRFRAGDSLREMASDYQVDEEEIEEALRFEQRHAA